MPSSVKFAADFFAMPEADIAAMVGEAQIRRLKAFEPHPKIRVYCIGHEGTVVPGVKERGHEHGPSVARLALNFFKAAVETIKTALGLGTPVYDGHGKGTVRDPIGEVVGTATAATEHGHSALAALYLYPGVPDRDSFDVVSMEGDFTSAVGADGSINVTSIDSITGVAVGRSRDNTPGFPGARLLGSLAAFAEGNDGGTPPGGKAMTQDEVRQAVRDGRFKPADIFTPEQLKGDPEVKELLNEANRQGYESGRNQFGKKAEELQEKLTAAEKALEEGKGFKSEALKSRLSSKVDVVATKRSLTDKQKATALKMLSKLDGNAIPADDKGMEALIDAAVEDALEVDKLYGGGGTAPEKKPGTPTPKTDTPPPADPEDWSNPANNPLIVPEETKK